MNQENVQFQNENESGDDMNQENVYVENANEAGDDMNQDNETVGRRRHVKQVNRRTTRQQKRGRSPSSEASELGVSIKNKERMIKKKNLDIRSEKKKMYTQIPDFFTFAKMISTMKLVFEELPLASKRMKLTELQKEAENDVKNLLGVYADASLGVDENIIDSMVNIFSLGMDKLLLNNEDGGVFLSSRASVSVPFSQELEKLRTDVEQLRMEKEALENRLNEIVQR